VSEGLDGLLAWERSREIKIDRPAWLTWNDLIKKVVARFARGNIAAQEGRILLPEEQAEDRDRARAIARGWRHRAKAAKN
jgi:hypothetical protein